MKRTIAALVAVAVLPLALALAAAGPSTNEPAPQPVTERGTVHTITLPEAPYELPDAPGRETVVGNCAVCHTLAYIMIQPPLSQTRSRRSLIISLRCVVSLRSNGRCVVGGMGMYSRPWGSLD
jgi:hypothetical protein